jgi:hypothetical protein
MLNQHILKLYYILAKLKITIIQNEIIEPIIESYCNQFIDNCKIDEITYNRIFKGLKGIRTNPKNIEGYDELYESINKYKFLYSINNELLQSYSDSEKINVIKKNIELCKDNISIVCYYLIEQPEQAL